MGKIWPKYDYLIRKTMSDAINTSFRYPHPLLSAFVESYWVMENPHDQDEEVVTFPDGGIDLYFFRNEEFPIHASLVGLETHSKSAFMPKRSILFGVRLKVLAAEYLLKRPVADFLNDNITLENSFAQITTEDLYDFDHFADKLEGHFLSLLTDTLDPRKQIMSDMIYSTSGATTVKEIAEAANWSSRQINRYFNKWLGLALKSYCDILRFRHSFDSLKKGELFPEKGFNDQSHYIKLIKKYSSHTPKQLAHDKSDRFIQLSSKK